MGPTASGKSAVALELARRFALEIVSVDSALVYRDMNIGTAKPDCNTLRQVRHHLIDLIDPTQSYSAAQFRDDALQAMRGISERGGMPLLTGGTMLYFKALRDGLATLPASDPATRQRIDALAGAKGWPAMHDELRRVDPVTARRLDPNDSQRIQRALEIFHLTGKPMASLIALSAPAGLPYRLVSIALVPGDRAVLHRRIAQRFDQMLDLGLIEEVRQLRSRYALNADLPSMRCVGYRQVWQHLEGDFGLDVLREKAIAATRQLAKRQLTWLRATGGVQTFDCLAADLPEQITTWLPRQFER